MTTRTDNDVTARDAFNGLTPATQVAVQVLLTEVLCFEEGRPLTSRGLDSLDFAEVSVDGLVRALAMAVEAGRSDGPVDDATVDLVDRWHNA